MGPIIPDTSKLEDLNDRVEDASEVLKIQSQLGWCPTQRLHGLTFMTQLFFVFNHPNLFIFFMLGENF